MVAHCNAQRTNRAASSGIMPRSARSRRSPLSVVLLSHRAFRLDASIPSLHCDARPLETPDNARREREGDILGRLRTRLRGHGCPLCSRLLWLSCRYDLRPLLHSDPRDRPRVGVLLGIVRVTRSLGWGIVAGTVTSLVVQCAVLVSLAFVLGDSAGPCASTQRPLLRRSAHMAGCVKPRATRISWHAWRMQVCRRADMCDSQSSGRRVIIRGGASCFHRCSRCSSGCAAERSVFACSSG
jgi:hypothetical protein